jgi:phenylpropionate dioxygenase-like ring-hydroxylating dioxygenase large terminal subunit
MGERLVAFRDTTGRIGLLEEACPHRATSLYYGCNEENGLRCLYHGWKYDVTGACVDMPSEPAEYEFKRKVQALSYPARERADFIWAYLGPPELTPELPDFEFALVPSEHRYVSKFHQECNFFQGIEGDIDSSHLPFLHARLDARGKSATATSLGAKYILDDNPPRWKVKATDYGVVLGARRRAEADTDYWRVNHVLLPTTTLIAPEPGSFMFGHAWVPIDDHRTMVMGFTWHPDRPMTAEERAQRRAGEDQELIPGTFDRIRNYGNDFLQDRQMQKTTSYSGITFPNGDSIFRDQDMAMTQSMGQIVDRRREHLGTSDRAIIAMRKRLINQAIALAEGEEPAQPHRPDVYRVHPWASLIPKGTDFDEDESFVDRMTVRR